MTFDKLGPELVPCGTLQSVTGRRSSQPTNPITLRNAIKDYKWYPDVLLGQGIEIL